MAKTKAPAAAAAPEETAPEETAPESTDPLAGLSDEGSQEFVEDLLTQASGLQDEKDALFARIDANRTTLRTIAKTGLLSEKQKAAIDLWYPPRTKKAATDEPAA